MPKTALTILSFTHHSKLSAKQKQANSTHQNPNLKFAKVQQQSQQKLSPDEW